MPYTGALPTSGTSGGTGGSNPPPVFGYRHAQPTPASEWVIEHNLGFRPAGVHVTDDSGGDVLGVVTHSDLNTTVIAFALPLAGTADLS